MWYHCRHSKWSILTNSIVKVNRSTWIFQQKDPSSSPTWNPASQILIWQHHGAHAKDVYAPSVSKHNYDLYIVTSYYTQTSCSEFRSGVPVNDQPTMLSCPSINSKLRASEMKFAIIICISRNTPVNFRARFIYWPEVAEGGCHCNGFVLDASQEKAVCRLPHSLGLPLFYIKSYQKHKTKSEFFQESGPNTTWRLFLVGKTSWWPSWVLSSTSPWLHHELRTLATNRFSSCTNTKLSHPFFLNQSFWRNGNVPQ